MSHCIYIKNKFSKIGVFEKTRLRVRVITATQRDNTIDCGLYVDDICMVELSRFMYMYNVSIEDYGIKFEHVVEGLEKNVNGSYIELDASVENDIRYCNPRIIFTGTYTGCHYNAEMLDHNNFVADIVIEGVCRYNGLFKEYKDSIGKILECIECIKYENMLNAFENAYIGLEMLIKKVENISYLTPIETRDYLLSYGVNRYRANKIRVFRNNEKIHPNEYGYFEQNPCLEDELEEVVELVLKSYFKIFENAILPITG